MLFSAVQFPKQQAPKAAKKVEVKPEGLRVIKVADVPALVKALFK